MQKNLKEKKKGAYPLKTFVDITILNSSPMEHLSSLWQKLGNGWRLLLTVAT